MFAQLAQGRCAGLTVVTPNQRLAAALSRDFDARQDEKNLASWETADILPVSAFIERLYQDALYSELAAKLPILLSSAQELSLWEDVVRGSKAGAGLLSVTSAAALARDAWQLAHAWRLLPRLKGYPANDDAHAFADWAWRYEGITGRERQCERARLADVVSAHLAHAALRKPGTLVAYGFDVLTAQQREFFAALERAGARILACGPELRRAHARRVAFASAREEIRAAARWARSRLEADPEAHIGIVVPDLAQSRNALRRVLAQVTAPGHSLAGAEGGALPFNLSLGEPLSSYPIVAGALLALELARSAAGGDMEFARASRLLRSPFIAGAEAELASRAQLDAELRRVAGPRICLERMRRSIAKLTDSDSRYAIPACPILSRGLADLSVCARENLAGSKGPAEWARAMSALLDAIGFPGERALDSVEYQSLKKFHEALAALAALGRVAARMRFDEACARLERIVADTLFQPEAPEVPIQVLGVLESAGMEFDHLWVMGLTDETWPIPARPNPFVPVALQRAAGVPEASAGASLELDARLTRGWLGAAAEVVLSHPLREEDRELVASPLIRDVQTATPAEFALPEYESLRDAIRKARREERVSDHRAPGLAGSGAVPGGTGIFKDQAACPFRAFAIHRLRAEGLDTPAVGPDAAERGTLLHAMLARVWQELKSQVQLVGTSDGDLQTLIARAADYAIARVRSRRSDAIEGRFAEIEKMRLMTLCRAWLDLERARPPFEVAALEDKRPVSFGGVTANARLDRMDKLEGAGRAILDYKTGDATVGGWFGARPDDPQLPLYALSSAEDIAAVAFARVKAGEMGFRGVAREAGLIPGASTLDKQRANAAKQYGSWEELLAGWRAELEALGTGFAQGDARVDPKRGELTCRYCDLKPLCRINERASSIGGDDETPLSPGGRRAGGEGA
ncbi:MAG: PD-(D/E)XK nuclease family protein [Betaproteobacteria bacterium]|nr:PD-(D/E)XK nuclease family protein [Betaproteobacteria bacterium]